MASEQTITTLNELLKIIPDCLQQSLDTLCEHGVQAIIDPNTGKVLQFLSEDTPISGHLKSMNDPLGCFGLSLNIYSRWNKPKTSLSDKI